MDFQLLRDQNALILTEHEIEAADLEDFLASKGVGSILHLRNAQDALTALRHGTLLVDLAIVGLPRSDLADEVCNLMRGSGSALILLDGAEGQEEDAVCSASVSRPFVDEDLLKALCKIGFGVNSGAAAPSR